MPNLIEHWHLEMFFRKSLVLASFLQLSFALDSSTNATGCGPFFLLLNLSFLTDISKVQPLMYTRFHPGVVKPSGWMLDQAHIQANGLAGNLADIYS